jgi:hypothetical protein
MGRPRKNVEEKKEAIPAQAEEIGDFEEKETPTNEGEDPDPYFDDDEDEELEEEDEGLADADLEAEQAASALEQEEEKEDPVERPAPPVTLKKAQKKQPAPPRFDPKKRYLIDLDKEEKNAAAEKRAALEPGENKQLGYLNDHGILFPVGFKFKGGRVSWRGSIVLNRCPKCGHQNMSTDAVKGVCANDKVKGTGEPCGYSLIDSVEKIRDVK